MQRLARAELEQYSQEVIDLFHHYDDIIAILNRHLPPSVATVLARLEINGNFVEWYSELQGQPHLLDDNLHRTAKENAENIIFQRLIAIEKLYENLCRKNVIDPDLLIHLKKFIDLVKEHEIQIYLINQQPVITAFGAKKKNNANPPPPVEPNAQKATRRWLWLLPFLLLMVAGFLLWWFYFRQPVMPQPVVAPPKPEVTKHCRKVEKNTDIPQLAIMFNNSVGMKYTLLESKEAVRAFDEKLSRDRIPQAEIDYMDRLPNRSIAAKDAVNQLINDLPNAIDIGLVELQSCENKSSEQSATISHGIFRAAQRNELKSKVQNMTVRAHRVPGAPIYEGLQNALKLVDGKEREALIVLITEGNGDCTERKICAMMEEVAKERPKLKLNIVSINSPWNGTDCLANATGGQIFNHDMTSQEKLTDAIKQAMKPVQQEICE